MPHGVHCRINEADHNDQSAAVVPERVELAVILDILWGVGHDVLLVRDLLNAVQRICAREAIPATIG
jgi:hypothetical protein